MVRATDHNAVYQRTREGIDQRSHQLYSQSYLPSWLLLSSLVLVN